MAASRPISRATASPIFPPGGLYCSRTRSRVLPAGFLEVHRPGAAPHPSLRANASQSPCLGTSLMISAFHSTSRTGRPLCPPARERVGDALDRFEMAHEPRQVLEVAPEAV